MSPRPEALLYSILQLQKKIDSEKDPQARSEFGLMQPVI